MIAILSIDDNWGIGRDNDLLLSIPEDMKFFRSKTLNRTVILGRKNLESFPGGRPLPKRKNIVLSTGLEEGEGYSVVRSVDELLELVGREDPEAVLVKNGKSPSTDCAADGEDEKTFVIGGAQIYSLLLPYCRRVYITRMYRDLKPDCYFPDLDASDEWEIVYRSGKKSFEGTDFEYLTYERRG